MVDLTSKESFRNIRKWENRARDHGCDLKKISTIIVANKNDAMKKVFYFIYFIYFILFFYLFLLFYLFILFYI